MPGGNQGILLPVSTVTVEKELLLPWNQITESSVYFGHSNVWEMSGGGIDPGISPFLVHPDQFRKQNMSKITLHFKYNILSW